MSEYKKLYEFMLTNGELSSMFVGNWEEDSYLFIREQQDLESLLTTEYIDEEYNY
jgi:hypothetical protein